eukprot:g19111.t1
MPATPAKHDVSKRPLTVTGESNEKEFKMSKQLMAQLMMEKDPAKIGKMMLEAGVSTQLDMDAGDKDGGAKEAFVDAKEEKDGGAEEKEFLAKEKEIEKLAKDDEDRMVQEGFEPAAGGSMSFKMRVKDAFVAPDLDDYTNKPGKAASSKDVGLGASSKDVGLGASSKQGDGWEAPLASYYPKDPSKEREWDTPESEVFHTFCQEVTTNLIIVTKDVEALNETRVKLKKDKSAVAKENEYRRWRLWKTSKGHKMSRAIESGPMKGAEIDQDSTIVGSLCYNHSEGRDMNEAQWKNLTQVPIFGYSYPRYWLFERKKWDLQWLKRIVTSRQFLGCRWVRPLVELNSDSDDEAWRNKRG